MLPVGNKFEQDRYLVFATKKGQVCKQSLSLYGNPRKAGIKAINIEDGDELVDVKLTCGQSEMLLATQKGMAIRFHETDMRPLGRFTGGVKGISLNKDDIVIGLEAPRPGADLLTVCANGFGKKSKVDDYRLINRGGKGVINIKSTTRNGDVVAVKEVIDEDELIMITRDGMSIRSRVADLRTLSRNTQGVKMINVKDDDVVVGVARLAEKDDEVEFDENGDPIVTALEDCDDLEGGEGAAETEAGPETEA